MAVFSHIAIIFNPKSSGDSKKQAQALHKKLQTALRRVTIETIPTKHAGHAELLAYELAKKHANPLIVTLLPYNPKLAKIFL